MHETALVHGVIDTVLDHARAAGANEVKAVYLAIGEGRDIVEDYFNGLFAFLAKGTVAEHAKLIIKRVPFTVRCNQCHEVFPINLFDSSTWVCPHCAAECDYQFNSGMEFMINTIQIAR